MFYDHLTMEQQGNYSGGLLQQTGTFCNGNMTLAVWQDSSVDHSQWYHDGVAIPGANDSTLALSTLGLPPGPYQVVVTDDSLNCGMSSIEIPFPEYPDPNPGPGNLIGCVPLYVHFTNNADPLLTGTTHWEINDGVDTWVPSLNHTFNDTGLFWVKLTVTSPDGCIGVDTIYVDVNDCTAIDENGAHGTLAAWFTGEELHVQLPEPRGEIEAVLYDATGRVVLREQCIATGGSFAIEQRLPLGVYTITINVGGKVLTARMVKTRN